MIDYGSNRVQQNQQRVSTQSKRFASFDKMVRRPAAVMAWYWFLGVQGALACLIILITVVGLWAGWWQVGQTVPELVLGWAFSFFAALAAAGLGGAKFFAKYYDQHRIDSKVRHDRVQSETVSVPHRDLKVGVEDVAIARPDEQIPGTRVMVKGKHLSALINHVANLPEEERGMVLIDRKTMKCGGSTEGIYRAALKKVGLMANNNYLTEEGLNWFNEVIG